MYLSAETKESDYLLFFFILLAQIWGAKFKKSNLLYFYLVLTFFSY